MKEKNLQEWLNTAVSGIRFKPDRKAVEEELRGHFEDKVADLQRFYHISSEKAEEMALERMGNAEEIGREMAKIHKPWLGWLWRVSQAALLVSVILWLLSCVYHGEPSPLRHREEEPEETVRAELDVEVRNYTAGEPFEMKLKETRREDGLFCFWFDPTTKDAYGEPLGINWVRGNYVLQLYKEDGSLIGEHTGYLDDGLYSGRIYMW